MYRVAIVLLAIGLVAPVQGEPEKSAANQQPKVRLKYKLRLGARYSGSNTVSYDVKTTVRQGDKVTVSSRSLQRTERFVDKIVRAGENGIVEIKRDYLRLYSKAREEGAERPTVHQSPTQGRTVILREERGRRSIKLDGAGAVDPIVRRIAGLELDWRYLFPEDPVGVGDKWEAEMSALAKRMGIYLQCGTKSKMSVRYEENLIRDGARLAKFYVDWALDGMRDRRFYTKVTLAGDVYFDRDLQRIVKIDLGGSMIVRGAIMGTGQPKIFKGEGPITYTHTLSEAPLQAAVEEK
ncbi:MAG: hypothetical protein ACYTGN_02510 [Planctomycetota bacterium]|jgi:hypothetical protein